jgi:high-affinity iron transporter
MTLRVALFAGLFTACGGAGTAAPVAAQSDPVTATPVATQAVATARTGAEVFAAHCAVCHGDDGRGNGPGAAGLEPPPQDLVGPRAAHLRGIPRRLIIEEGRPGTAMVGWKGVLSDADLEAVYGYVHGLKHGG